MMERHAVMALIIAIIVLAWWALIQSSLIAAPFAQTTSRTYNNLVTAQFLAQELGIPAASITDITIGARGAGCSITFADLIISHQDEHTDNAGTTVTIRQQQQLTQFQERRLDEIMRSQGCFRSR